MKIYCAHVFVESFGYRSRQWFATKKEANAFIRSTQAAMSRGMERSEVDWDDPWEDTQQSDGDQCSIELVVLGARKSDLLEFLNEVAFHDNG